MSSVTVGMRAWAGWRRWPLVTIGGALIALGLIALPLVFLVVEALQSGSGELQRILFRHQVAVLLFNTVRLAVVTTILCAVIGTAAAWLVTRTALPGRRWWAVALVLPLGVPEFVVGYSWISLTPSFEGFWAAVLITTLSTYPLVYLPVAASLARVDPVLTDVGRSLGLNPWQAFVRVTLRQVWPAVLGGCLLVTLGLLAEYGAFEIVRFQTFTVEIFTEFKLGFDTPTASALSLILVALGLLVLAGELVLTGRGRVARVGSGAPREPVRVALGRWTAPAVLALGLIVVLALGVPLFSLAYWLIKGSSTTLPSAGLLTAALHTALLGAAAGVLATALALPVVIAAVRYRNRLTVTMERLAYLPQALPGLVVALGLVSFAVRDAFALYQGVLLLVIAYAILFLPLAVVGVHAAMVLVPSGLVDVGRSLGRRPFWVWLRVVVPLIAPGLAAAFALVFISTTTELTATLLLHPTGIDTLATQFWTYTTGVAYGAAAPYAALMIAISAVPAYLLSRQLTALARRSAP
jgi:iron(III) transport system permease protein